VRPPFQALQPAQRLQPDQLELLIDVCDSARRRAWDAAIGGGSGAAIVANGVPGLGLGEAGSSGLREGMADEKLENAHAGI
jgi:hypothetical protein